MIGLVITLIMGIAVIAFYFNYSMIYGFCFGVVFTYLFTTERMFGKSMGRNPSIDESNDILKHLLSR